MNILALFRKPKQVFIVPHYTVRPIDRKAKRNAKCMELAAELGPEYVAKVAKLRAREAV
jgi:hypothetical protein